MNIESVLKSHGLGGRFGSHDRFPPPPVKNLKQVSSNHRIELTWENPVDTDFAGLIIVRNQERYPMDRHDGIMIFDGVATSYLDQGLTNYQDYYYRIFTYDYDHNYNDDILQQIKGMPEELFIYGLTIDTNDSNPETCITYTHDAEHFSPGGQSWQDTWLFRGIRPVLLNKDGVVVAELNKDDFSKDINGNPVTLFGEHNVMIEFPKFYTYARKEGTKIHITASRRMTVPRFNAAFGFYKDKEVTVWTSEDGKQNEFYFPEADCFYLAAYPSTHYENKLRSWSWEYLRREELSKLKHNLRFLRAQGLAEANGAGYGLMHYQQYQIVTLLYLFWFKSLDSQSKIGKGNPVLYPGTLNQSGMTVVSVGDTPNKLFGMEAFWSGLGATATTWIDGLKAEGDPVVNKNEFKLQYGVHKDDNYFLLFAAEGEKFSGYVSDVRGDEMGSAFLPKAVRGSATTYFCDSVNWQLRKNTETWDYDHLNIRRATTGHQGDGAGIFSVNLHRFDYSSDLDSNPVLEYPSSRLCYVPAFKQPNWTITKILKDGGSLEWILNTF
ncbi:fibronectin type III domain-containing protein [Pseudobacillus badius]|uniref:fibronectin type III domain-containing protein n=1 Tax=Bacillus badius TaxID=1455 RepID=UPI0007B322B1|nr:fibronectin type III domain-containing protein [Bacillus badius]KZR58983.1 hypothetical protein A3781_00295 [Bacillus badius]